jgi:hypothetical protein
MEQQGVVGDACLHGDALNVVAQTGDAAATLALLPRLVPYPDLTAYNQVSRLLTTNGKCRIQRFR